MSVSSLRRFRLRPLNILKNLAIWLVTASMLIPLLLIIVNSFKDRYQAAPMALSLPVDWHPENFATVIKEGKLIVSFFNSLIYAAFSTGLSSVLAAMAAFVLSRDRTKARRFLYFFIVLGIAMPVNYVSLTKVVQILHLMNSRIGVILIYAAMQIPFAVFLMFGFISSVPREMDEAAIIDGCRPLRLFFSIVMPLMKPVVVTAVVLNFMGSWNDFIIPLYFTNSASKWPMTMAVYNFFGQFEMQWNLVSADILLTSLPVIAVYLAGQRYIIGGMTSGAIKG